LAFPLYIDEGLQKNARIAFNAGMLTRSLILSGTDYFLVAAGHPGRFAQQ
jgi:prolyl-tRNA editing enzyme YbaK/EbsC (Cys-tRNA(Pro) deacylase)